MAENCSNLAIIWRLLDFDRAHKTMTASYTAPAMLIAAGWVLGVTRQQGEATGLEPECGSQLSSSLYNSKFKNTIHVLIRLDRGEYDPAGHLTQCKQPSD